MLSRKEELGIWKDRIKKSIDYRKKFLSDWNYWEQIYDNNLWATNKFGSRTAIPNPSSPVQINELDTIVNTIIPRILYSYPIFDVEDMASGNTLAALVYEVFALKLYEVLDMYNTLREVVTDTLILGTGIHKTGMVFDVEMNEYRADSGIYNEMPMSCYVQPRNFLWDYRFDDWSQIRWMAEEIEKPLEEVRDSDLYKGAGKLKGNVSSLEYLPQQFNQNYKREDDVVRLIEIHDLVKGKIYTIVLDHPEFLQYDDDYGICIYDALEFTKTRPKRMFGKSISQDIEQHLVRLSLNNHWMDEDGKSAARRMYMVDNSIGKQAIQKIDSDEARVLVPIDGLMGMSGDPIREIRTSNNVFQWQTTLGMIERQIRQLAGSTAADRGIHEAGVETAVEAQMLQDSSETRNKDRGMLLSLYIQKIMSKMLMLSSAYMKPERIANLLGMPIQDAYMIEPFDNMKLTVKYGSTAIESREMYKQKLIQVSQMFPDLVNRGGLMQKFMSALGFGLRDQDMMLSQTPRPAEQQTVVQKPETLQGGA